MIISGFLFTIGVILALILLNNIKLVLAISSALLLIGIVIGIPLSLIVWQYSKWGTSFIWGMILLGLTIYLIIKYKNPSDT